MGLARQSGPGFDAGVEAITAVSFAYGETDEF